MDRKIGLFSHVLPFTLKIEMSEIDQITVLEWLTETKNFLSRLMYHNRLMWSDMSKPDMCFHYINYWLSNHKGLDRRLKSYQPVKPT